MRTRGSRAKIHPAGAPARLFDREVRRLAGAVARPGRPSREVRLIAEAHVGDLEARIADMQAMDKTLRELVRKCHGDDRPDCPILDDLAQGGGLPHAEAPVGTAGREAREG